MLIQMQENNTLPQSVKSKRVLVQNIPLCLKYKIKMK